MPQPRRRLVIFKSGGYIMSDLEDLLASSGLSHVMRVTNLIRKAHCVLAKERWENGRRVRLEQHMQGAARRGLPFLLLKGHRMELPALLALGRAGAGAGGAVGAGARGRGAWADDFSDGEASASYDEE
ncbi:hypothetical protein MNEG_5711 [Monoraphidium neglectum]|uniref:Uncharacterized protein n=1 Tax=Monoraphidium neglectum TaxID=145388 RepID=A0A0D2MGP8_9CHLO|nr:hypothetical protein MNEG_5711 [Monoraphidium neglectum]KIZ02250.1 hypothetical protein MNEG_5711 [Monoraphidium neglectum]|eukprot:XP_013901269.1 hypothetical protein MNEG_5711 [Monoraphidium neglectum]